MYCTHAHTYIGTLVCECTVLRTYVIYVQYVYNVLYIQGAHVYVHVFVSLQYIHITNCMYIHMWNCIHHVWLACSSFVCVHFSACSPNHVHHVHMYVRMRVFSNTFCETSSSLVSIITVYRYTCSLECVMFQG